jgi:chromosome segregation ATPase
MADDLIHARVSAVKEIEHGLTSYGKSLNAALASARTDVNRAQAEFQLAVVDSQRRLLAAERRTEMAAADLARCREGCEALEQALARARVEQQEAKRRADGNRQAQARFERASTDLYSTLRTIETSANELVPAGRKFVKEYAEMLTEYLKTSVSR